MLNTLEFGPDATPKAPPLLIAHGLFGSARNWGVVAKRLAVERRVICVDMRNHGASFHADDMTYGAMAADLAEVAEGLGAFDLLGHSMGGKAAMAAALSGLAPRRLIVADIAPAAYTHTQAHYIDAMEALDLAEITTRAEADAALSAHVSEPAIRAFLLQSLDVRAAKWRLNLPALRASMPDIIGFPHYDGAALQPTLFLAGAASDYVRPEHRAEIKRLFPAARFAKIPGAGHWLHAEKPREFEAALRAFLG